MSWTVAPWPHRVRSSRSSRRGSASTHRCSAPPSWRSNRSSPIPPTGCRPSGVIAPAALTSSPTTGGATNMNRSSRLHRGRPRRLGEETRMHVRRSAALVMSAALVLVACGGDDDDSMPGREGTEPAPATTAAGGEGGATTEAGGAAPATTARRRWWRRRLRRRRVLEQLPGRALGEVGRAGPQGRPSRPVAARYISNDAKSSAETQASNVENLISQGANVLVILAQDGTAIKPSVAAAAESRHPGHRLRPAHRGSVGALRHVRQRQGR